VCVDKDKKLQTILKVTIGSVGIVIVLAILLITTLQTQTKENITIQQHPCYKLYFQIQDIRDELLSVERFNPELLAKLQGTVNEFVVEHSCGKKLNEWKTDEINIELDPLFSNLDSQPKFVDELILNVFDLNFCPNQNTIIGELWFLLDETTTVPVGATVNYEIKDFDDLIEERKIRISPEDFRNWKLFGREMYAYDFEIPVKSNVEGKDLLISVMVDGGNNLVYEYKIKHIDSLENCKFS